MFLKRIDKLFNGMPNVFGIADDILIAGLDELGRDHSAILDKVMRICRQSNLKINKDKYFRCTSIPFSVKQFYCRMSACTLEMYGH